MAAAAGWYFYSSGYLLYYGDAQAHLNISRSWIDSRTPGYDQLGTVWLPLLHLICLPFVGSDALWSSGLAATFPVATCFVIAGVCLYLCGREVYGARSASLAVLLCFAINPNVLYLSTTAMTELVFAAALSACLLALLRFARTQNRWYIALCVFASWWMSLTRYDGWFLIPFITVLCATAAKKHKLAVLVAVGGLAALAPLYWVANNWWETGNALDFYNGPYSAAAIQRYQKYPGYHDWPQAIHYYWEAGRACCGNGLAMVGVAGLVTAIWTKRWVSTAFLSLTPIFYVWSLHSSWTPIYLPWLWPHGYYNSRYGFAVVVLVAFSAGALAAAVPKRMKALTCVVPLMAILPWCLEPKPDHWICWKESQQNSISRRAWTSKAAAFWEIHYQRGDGLLTEFGDLAGIFCRLGLPLKEGLHEGNGPEWFINTHSNGLVTETKWAMAQEGDKLAKQISQIGTFQLVDKIKVEGAPALLIYERRHKGEMP